MTSYPGRAMVLAVLLAVLMHLMLFVTALPSAGRDAIDETTVPQTSYLFSPSEGDVSDVGVVRAVLSPVVFALPTSMGFSGVLPSQDVQTRLSFAQKVNAEQFLSVPAGAMSTVFSSDPGEWTVYTAADGDPGIPKTGFHKHANKGLSLRASMAPEIRNRLSGGLVLPPALNRPTATPWEVKASILISEQGGVEHIFIEKPLESQELNSQVLQLLKGLRFKPGASQVGIIELYSPEQNAVEEATE